MAMNYDRQRVVDFLNHRDFRYRMMDDTKQATFSIEKEVLERLKVFHQDTGMKMKVIVNVALEQFLERYAHYKENESVPQIIDLTQDNKSQTFIL